MPTEATERLLLGLILVGLGLAVAGGIVVVSAVSVVLLPVPFALLAAAAVAFVALHEPKWALLLALSTLPFERMMTLFPVEGDAQQGFLNTLTVAKVMLAVIIPVWLLRVLVLKDGSVLTRTFATPIPAVAMMFAFYTTISAVNAVSMGNYIKNQSTIVSNVVLFLVVLNVLDDKRWALRTIWVLFVPYVIVGFIGIFEIYTQAHILELMGRTMPEEAFVLYGGAFRPAGPSGDPDYFATSVLFGLMLTLAVWRFVKSRWMWVAFVVLIGIFMVDIFGTVSRGAMLAFLAGIAVFWWFLEMPYKRAVAVLAIVGGLSGFALYSTLVSARAASRYSGGETKSLEYRLGWQQQLFGMIEANPIFGVGTGNSLPNQHRFFDPRPPRKPENSANTYLQLAAEAGIPSLALYVGFFGLVLLYLVKVILRADDPEIRHLATCLLSALSAFFVFAGTAHALYNEVTWTLLGLSVALGQAARDPREAPGIAPAMAGVRARSAVRH